MEGYAWVRMRIDDHQSKVPEALVVTVVVVGSVACGCAVVAEVLQLVPFVPVVRLGPHGRVWMSMEGYGWNG